MKRYNHNKGFSLIELLVVIAIITIFMSIIIPVLGKVRSTAKCLICAHNLKQIDMTIRLYTDDYDDTFPCAEDPLPAGYWLWMGRGWRTLIGPYLGSDINEENPSVLFCPEDKTSKQKYESTSYSYSMSFYHSSAQIDSMTSTSDTYENALPSLPQRISQVRKPSSKIIIGEWLSSHEQIEDDKGWWCWQGTRNYLFVDGGIKTLRAVKIRSAQDSFPDANLTINGIKGSDLRN